MIKAEWTNDDALSTGQTTQTNDSNVLNAMDCVSRQAAIDELDVCAELLRRVLDDANIVGAEREKYGWGLGLIKSCIFDMKELQSVHPTPKWIPVTERLPEEGRRVLVTYDLVNSYPWVNILRYGKSIFEDKPCFYEVDSEWGDVPYDGIVAWMPLPKPYEKETEDGS